MRCSLFLSAILAVIVKSFQVITIERERYIVGEALFQPSILCLEEYGIVEQLVRSISSVSSENHRQLLENIVLCGGTASMTGVCSFSDTHYLIFLFKVVINIDKLEFYLVKQMTSYIFRLY